MTYNIRSFPSRHWLAALLCAAAAASVVACGRSGSKTTSAPAPTAVSPDTWAEVDGKAISRTEVEKALRQTADPNQVQSQEDALAARLSVLDDLITEEILVARAQKENIAATDAEIDEAVKNAKGNLTDDQFQQQLLARSLSTADVREALK